MLKIQNLGKSFNGKAALSDVTLDIAKGAFIGVIGRSGAGKHFIHAKAAPIEVSTENCSRIWNWPPGSDSIKRVKLRKVKGLPWMAAKWLSASFLAASKSWVLSLALKAI